MGGRISLFSGFSEPLGRLAELLRHPGASLVAKTEVTLGRSVILIRRTPKPLNRLCIILLHALAILVANTQMTLGDRVTLVGGLSYLVKRLPGSAVFLHALDGLQHRQYRAKFKSEQEFHQRNLGIPTNSKILEMAERQVQHVPAAGAIMNTPRPVVLIVALTIVLFSAFLVYALQPPKAHAGSRISVDPKETLPWPDFMGKDSEALMAYLNMPNTRKRLASVSRRQLEDFAVKRIVPVRGTSMFEISYAGKDSATTFCVASNAALMTIEFFATNRPAWELRYVDTDKFTPPSGWERIRSILGL